MMIGGRGARRRVLGELGMNLLQALSHSGPNGVKRLGDYAGGFFPAPSREYSKTWL